MSSTELPEEQQLTDLLYAGLFPDISDADHLRELLTTIGRRADDVNSARFGGLFGTLQGTLQNGVLLAVSRIFDPPPRQYPTRSIRAVAALLRDTASKLAVRDVAAIRRKAVLLAPRVQLPDHADAQRFTCQVASLIEDAVLSRKGSIDKVRQLRDKRIAHNEVIPKEELFGPTWKEVNELLDVGRAVAVVVGQGYLNTICEDVHGKWVLNYGPKGRAFEMDRAIDFVVEGARRERDNLTDG